MRTVPTAVPAVARRVPQPRRVAQAPPGVVGHRAAVGTPYRIAAAGGPVAAGDPDRADRFDRAPLATHPGRDRVGTSPAIFEARRTCQSAAAAPQAGACWCSTIRSRPTRCTLSTLALAYGGRALPLAWCRWSGKLHGSYWQQIDGLFEQAAAAAATRGPAGGPGRPRPGLTDTDPAGATSAAGTTWCACSATRPCARRATRSRRVLHLGDLLTRPGAPERHSRRLGLYRRSACGRIPRRSGGVAIRSRGCWSAISTWATGLADLYAQRMQVEALFRDAKSGGFEWELSRVVRAERAQRLLLGLMLALWCAVLLGEAAIRAGEIPAYGRRRTRSASSDAAWTGSPHRADHASSAGRSLHQKLSGYESPAGPPPPVAAPALRAYALLPAATPRLISRHLSCSEALGLQTTLAPQRTCPLR